MKCPRCQAEATQLGAFWICEIHGQLPEPKPFAPLPGWEKPDHCNAPRASCLSADNARLRLRILPL